MASLGRSPLVRFALVLLPFAVNASADTPSLQGPSQWNVVLVVSDALRAASLPIYGYPRDTAPSLRRLAEESVVFGTTSRTIRGHRCR
jgi:glucan phosphoethanolaminetransferase (alkaline phosphatase superfamily)